MQLDLNDVGGAKDLAKYRLEVAKEDLAAAEHCYLDEELRSSQ